MSSTSYVPASSLFAQVLASERVHVRINPNARTASFNMVSRVLELPNYTGFSEDAWLLFLAHEVGHALFTPQTYGPRIDAVAKAHRFTVNVVSAAFNIIEDIRIERLVRDKYRGLHGFFARGYHSLIHDKNFFGFPTGVLTVAQWKRYSPMDRINLYGKVGALIGRSLVDPQEARWYNRALANETFEDVEALVVEILLTLREQQQARAQKQQQPPPPPQQQKQEQQEQQQSTPRDDQDQDQEPASSQDANDDQDQQGPQGNDDQDQDDDQDAQSSPATDNADDTDTSDADPDTMSEGQDAPGANFDDLSETDPETDPIHTSGTEDMGQDDPTPTDTDPVLDETPETGTDPFHTETLDAANNTLQRNVGYAYAEQTIMLPLDLSFLRSHYVPLDVVLAGWSANATDRATLARVVEQLKREGLATLSSSVSTFRAHQAAQERQRARIARTGAIEPTRLASYKFTDDIFKRRTTVETGQSHGIVMTLDWSGSMRHKLPAVMMQTLHVIWLCEALRIPLDVYAFTDRPDELTKEATVAAGMFRAYCMHFYSTGATATVKREATAMMLGMTIDFAGYDLALSRTSREQTARTPRERAAAVLDHMNLPLLCKSHVEALIHSETTEALARMTTATRKEGLPFRLGGTALHHAMLAQVDVVRAFRQQHRVEQCISLWVTDGDDTYGVMTDVSHPIPSQSKNVTIIDPRSGRVFVPTVKDSMLPTFLEYHRHSTGAQTIVVDITSKPAKSFARVLADEDLEVIVAALGDKLVEKDAVAPAKRGKEKPAKQDVRAAERLQRVIASTRKRLLVNRKRRIAMPKVKGDFTTQGCVVADRSQFPDMGADVYIVTAEDWWLERSDRFNRFLNSIVSDLDWAVQSKVKSAMSGTNAQVAMRKFADLLVPYLAMGRDRA